VVETSREKLGISAKSIKRHDDSIQESEGVMFWGSDGGSYLQDGWGLARKPNSVLRLKEGGKTSVG
jgi:hypothetical protein